MTKRYVIDLADDLVYDHPDVCMEFDHIIELTNHGIITSLEAVKMIIAIHEREMEKEAKK